MSVMMHIREGAASTWAYIAVVLLALLFHPMPARTLSGISVVASDMRSVEDPN